MDQQRFHPHVSKGRRGHLIVTADDFGLAGEVNEAVEIAHRRGILSAASLMVAGPASADAIIRAKRLPNLRVGLHLVLLEEKPTLPPEQMAGLVDGSGRMRSDLVRLAFDLVGSSRLRSLLRKEIEAQFAAFLASGLRLDHVDVHKHYHLHPVVGREVIAAARQFGAGAVRVPVEPAAVIRRVEDRRMTSASLAFACCAGLLRPQVRRAGLLAPDAVFGLAWSGEFTATRLLGLLGELPGGVVEIYMHPATKDRFPGSASHYRYREELEALCSTEVLAQAERLGLRPVGYSDLAGGRRVRSAQFSVRPTTANSSARYRHRIISFQAARSDRNAGSALFHSGDPLPAQIFRGAPPPRYRLGFVTAYKQADAYIGRSFRAPSPPICQLCRATRFEGS